MSANETCKDQLEKIGALPFSKIEDEKLVVFAVPHL